MSESMKLFRLKLLAGLASIAVLCCCTSASAGDAPAAAKIDVTKDQQVCGDKNLMSEELVVAKDNSLANVMIWCKSKVKANPEYEKSASDIVTLDNKGCRFEPHVLGIRVGQTLSLKNSDPVAHNSNVAGKNIQANPLIPPGTTSEIKIEGPENVPALVSCNIHPWMKGRLMVRPATNPYFAVSDAKGNFEIKDLPAGELEFVVYHERSGYVTDASVKGESAKWPKGAVKFTIDAGKTLDLGDIKLGAAQFNK
jgi:plastocyanin